MWDVFVAACISEMVDVDCNGAEENNLIRFIRSRSNMNGTVILDLLDRLVAANNITRVVVNNKATHYFANNQNQK